MSFPHVRRILLANLPSVESVGIITAQNPNSRPYAKIENIKLNKMLLADLHGMGCGRSGCGAIKIMGRFGGNVEDSYLVPNIGKQELIDLGNKYRQTSVIWGIKKLSQDQKPFIEFQYLEGGRVAKISDMSVAGEDVESREGFYSAVKGRKFAIPFVNMAKPIQAEPEFVPSTEGIFESFKSFLGRRSG